MYDFLKSCTEEFDRLMETNPVIQKQIIQLFNRTFQWNHIDAKKREMFENLEKPEICDSLESVQFAMYKEDENTVKENKFKALISDVVNNSSSVNKQHKKAMKYKLIGEFVENFREMMKGPSKQEMINNLNINSLDNGEAMIVKYINENPDKFAVKNNVPNEIRDLGLSWEI